MSVLGLRAACRAKAGAARGNIEAYMFCLNAGALRRCGWIHNAALDLVRGTCAVGSCRRWEVAGQQGCYAAGKSDAAGSD
mgnify:CR=1 FL=1